MSSWIIRPKKCSNSRRLCRAMTTSAILIGSMRKSGWGKFARAVSRLADGPPSGSTTGKSCPHRCHRDWTGHDRRRDIPLNIASLVDHPQRHDYRRRPDIAADHLQRLRSWTASRKPTRWANGSTSIAKVPRGFARRYAGVARAWGALYAALHVRLDKLASTAIMERLEKLEVAVAGKTEMRAVDTVSNCCSHDRLLTRFSVSPLAKPWRICATSKPPVAQRWRQ